MIWKIAACASLLALTGAACSETAGSGTNGPRVIPLSGEVRLFQDDGSVLLEEATALSPGDRLQAGVDGWARVELPGAGSVELAPQSGIRMGEDRPEVLGGSVLARAGLGLTLHTGGAEIEGTESVFRVDRGFSTTLAVYQGQASVLGSGLAPVPALRETTVVAGGLIPRGPVPLRVRPDHPWDVRLLGEAIDAGLQLVRVQRGLARQLPSGSATGAVMAAFEDAFPARRIEDLLKSVRAAETVVAAVVAEQAASSAGLGLLQALDDVIDLRLQGAHWIVVVAQWGLIPDPLLEEMGRITGSIVRFLAPPPSDRASVAGSDTTGGGGGSAGTTTAGGGSGTGDGSVGGGDSGGGGVGDTTTGGDSGGGGGGGSGSTEEPTPPPPTCGNEVECAVEDLVGELEGPGLP